jgi:hypothetical protein
VLWPLLEGLTERRSKLLLLVEWVLVSAGLHSAPAVAAAAAAPTAVASAAEGVGFLGAAPANVAVTREMGPSMLRMAFCKQAS